MSNLPSESIATCNCTALRKASRRVSQMYDVALAPSGLKSTQYSVLCEINRHTDSPPTISELAEIMVMDRSTLGQNLIPLQREGWVSARPSGADRRRKLLVLTRKGRSKLAQARALWLAAQERFQESLGSTETHRLRAILLGIAANSGLSGPRG